MTDTFITDSYGKKNQGNNKQMHSTGLLRIERNRTTDGDTMICVVEGNETIWQGYDSPKNVDLAARIVACVNACAGIPVLERDAAR